MIIDRKRFYTFQVTDHLVDENVIHVKLRYDMMLISHVFLLS